MADGLSELDEHFVTELIEKKLKPVEDGLSQLQNAHDAITTQHTNKLLELERVVAALKVNSDSASFVSIIDSQLQKKSSLRNQVMVDAAQTKEKILTANNPPQYLSEFRNKWLKTLRDLGADFTTF